MKKFEPTGDRILIRPADPDAMRAGIQLLGSDVESKYEGEVIEVGDGVPIHDIRLNITGDVSDANLEKLRPIIELILKGRPIRYAKGDYVIYGRYSGTKILVNEVEHVIIRESDVFGKLT